jgi:hypothetical protein
MAIVKNPYQQLLVPPKSTLELLGVSKSTNNLIGDLSAAAGGGAALGAAGAGAAGGEAAAGETAAGAGGAGAGAGAATATATNAVSQAAKALAGASVLGFLSSGQNWIRLLEVIAGVILVVMGLHQLTGAGNTVVGVAKTAAKVAR